MKFSARPRGTIRYSALFFAAVIALSISLERNKKVIKARPETVRMEQLEVPAPAVDSTAQVNVARAHRRGGRMIASRAPASVPMSAEIAAHLDPERVARKMQNESAPPRASLMTLYHEQKGTPAVQE